MPAETRLRIGLTGGIGSGKSTVAKLLAEHGAAVIDTDAIARELTLPGGPAIDSLRRAFGDDFIDDRGGLDRAHMRAHAFTDPQAKSRLEAILHPLIGAQTEARAAASAERVLVFDVPLLAESRHWRAKVDKVIVVDCTAQTQVERVVARSGWAPEAVLSVIAQQAPREARRACADAMIFNDRLSMNDLRQQAQTLARRWFTSSA